MAGIVQKWVDFKAENPKTALGLQMLPLTGQVASGLDYYDDMDNGRYDQAKMDTIGFIPGGKLVKEGKALAKMAPEVAENLMAHVRRTGGSVDDVLARQAAQGAERRAAGRSIEAAAMAADLADYNQGAVPPRLQQLYRWAQGIFE